MTREEILMARVKASRYEQLMRMKEWALCLLAGCGVAILYAVR